MRRRRRLFNQHNSEPVRDSNLLLISSFLESWELVHGHGHFLQGVKFTLKLYKPRNWLWQLVVTTTYGYTSWYHSLHLVTGTYNQLWSAPISKQFASHNPNVVLPIQWNLSLWPPSTWENLFSKTIWFCPKKCLYRTKRPPPFKDHFFPLWSLKRGFTVPHSQHSAYCT
jgi:hypothetical protein